MSKTKIKGRDLVKLGYKQGRVVGIALNVMAKHFKYQSKKVKLDLLEQIMQNPQSFEADEKLGVIAKEFLEVAAKEEQQAKEIALNPEALGYKIYGKEGIEDGALAQMQTAMQLPITAAGALMPDAHYGYGLPIGGVLATENTVIPYGVGVDIGCRMCMSIYPLETAYLSQNRSQLKDYLMEHTRFGAGAHFKQPMDDAILERPEFKEIPFVKNLKSKAYSQIGSSGGGNHFVEFGVVEILDPNNEFDLNIGQYVAVLSHSGSRGLGANIAHHYTKIAKERCKLPKVAEHLAWLDLNSEAGMEYWLAMNLAGDYASACHHQIHKRLAKALGEQPLTMIENHHNFAWKEQLADGREVIVHRKGATPAGKGVLGIIPGSMTAPGFIVRGKGEANAINSASHGAGRVLSRRKAKAKLNKKEVRQYLKKQGVTLIGGGLDEAPMAYKDIHKVMEHQKDLVEIIGTFLPKIVRMASE